MIFTSYTYIAFLAIAFLIYWLLPIRWRNPFLIIASYVFYASWKWQFGFLLLALSVFNWAYGRWVLAQRESTSALSLGVAVNLSALLYYKYAGFFVANAAAVADLFGAHWHPSFGDIILPLGISFFTFQGIAYLFDVATGDEPLTSFSEFLLFKALWPQLIAGPIVRLGEMREQLAPRRSIDYDDVAYASQRILYGFLKKVVFADNIAPAVELVFSSTAVPNAIDAVTGIIGFGLQIYFDFSAYSDIAIGSARLFGFRFPENFDWPYLAKSPQEFWNRWHMTLSRWIRDYLFTPLTFSMRRRPKLAPISLLVAMALCGLWHGARWTFVIWGIWHGILLLLNQTVLRPFFPTPGRPMSRARSFAAWLVTLTLVFAGWLLFRATSLQQALVFAESIVTLRGGLRPTILRENWILMIGLVFAGLLLVQLLRGAWNRAQGRFGDTIARWAPRLAPVAYCLIILAVIIFDQEAKAFVYFQF
jgi:alginate O-acetyltransferase complex protein AlgI